MEIGDSITLYGVAYTPNAYTDPWGAKHSAYVLCFTEDITITDKRTDVPGQWNPSSKYTGYKAANKNNTAEFEYGWNIFYDDSHWGANWSLTKSVEAMRLYNGLHISWHTLKELEHWYKPLVDMMGNPLKVNEVTNGIGHV